MKKILSLIVFLGIAVFIQAQTMTVYLSGTVRFDSTGGSPVPSHEVIIQSNDSVAGFVFYTTRQTSAAGYYDCTITNVPTASAVTFTVLTRDCHNDWVTHTFLSTDSPATVNFVICNPVHCQSAFTYQQSTSNVLQYEFTDASTSGASVVAWLWNFGDPASGAGNTSSVQNSTHVFTAAGIYTVCLYITTSDGCTSHSCQQIHAGSSPCEAGFTYHADSLHATEIHFTDTSTPHSLITSWNWSFGDGSASSVENPDHLYPIYGIYTVCLTISTSNGCSSTICDSIVVGGSPPANCENNFTYTSALLTLTFHGTTSSAYPTTYTWQMGDPAGTVLNGKDVTFTYPAQGAYNVTLVTIDSVSCQWNRTKQVYAHSTCDLNGHVYMGIHTVDHGWIDLIKVDSNNVMTIVQGKEIGDSLGSYHFGGVSAGSYYLQARLLPASSRYGHFIPTYYESSLTWQGANLITLGAALNPYTIHLVECVPPSAGNGSIHGGISQGGIKFGGNGAGIPDVTVMLFDQNNNSLAYTITDTSGSFIFDNIAYGTYIVKPEKAGIVSTQAQTTIDNNKPSVTLPFTLSGGQIVYGIADPGANISYISDLYPNPAPGQKVSFKLNCIRETTLILKLFNTLGQAVIQEEVKIEAGPNSVELDISSLRAGPYFLKIQSTDDKIIIKKLTVLGETR
jgi:PKD repeat protein